MTLMKAIVKDMLTIDLLKYATIGLLAIESDVERQDQIKLRYILAVVTSCSLAAVLILKDVLSEFFWVGTGLVTICLALVFVASLRFKPYDGNDKLLLDWVQILKDKLQIKNLRLTRIEDVRLKAKRMLIEIAVIAAGAQDTQGEAAYNDVLSTQFKPIHDICVHFRLVEPKWDSYLDEGKAQYLEKKAKQIKPQGYIVSQTPHA